MVTIGHVERWTKHDDQEIGDYTFNDWALVGSTVTIYFCEALVIEIDVGQLEIRLVDVGFSGRARITRYPGGSQSTNSSVY